MEKSLLSFQEAQLINLQEEVFDPTFLNLGYLYNLILKTIIDILKFLLSPFLGVGPYENETLQNIFWFIALILLLALIYVFWKHYEIRKAEEEKYEELLESTEREVAETTRTTRWSKVLDHFDSLNEADWRLGIMEADNMLGDMLDGMGYLGETIGEQLQSVEPADFRTLQKAWEAHKVRNKIAHEGADFILTKREAQRVINLYREVFEEFRFV